MPIIFLVLVLKLIEATDDFSHFQKYNPQLRHLDEHYGDTELIKRLEQQRSLAKMRNFEKYVS